MVEMHSTVIDHWGHYIHSAFHDGQRKFRNNIRSRVNKSYRGKWVGCVNGMRMWERQSCIYRQSVNVTSLQRSIVDRRWFFAYSPTPLFPHVTTDYICVQRDCDEQAQRMRRRHVALLRAMRYFDAYRKGL